MIQFTAVLLQFEEQGEKTGWTYIHIQQNIAEQIKPNNKRSFRVKGKLDDFSISGIALMPMGGGEFVMPLNASIRKGIHKKEGAMLAAKLEVDKKEIKPPTEFVECLKDEPVAHEHFFSLAKSHQLYFTRWINSAKTEPTKTKRIAQAVNALSKKFDFGMMLRSIKQENDLLK